MNQEKNSLMIYIIYIFTELEQGVMNQSYRLMGDKL
jgi:hypothetical protein